MKKYANCFAAIEQLTEAIDTQIYTLEDARDQAQQVRVQMQQDISRVIETALRKLDSPTQSLHQEQHDAKHESPKRKTAGAESVLSNLIVLKQSPEWDSENREEPNWSFP